MYNGTYIVEVIDQKGDCDVRQNREKAKGYTYVLSKLTVYYTKKEYFAYNL